MDINENIDKACNFLRLSGYTHWKIYYGDSAKNYLAFESTNIVDNGTMLDIETSLEELKKRLELLPDGKYLMQCKLSPDEKNKLSNYYFKVDSGAAAIGRGNIQQPFAANPMAGYPANMFGDYVTKSVESAISGERIRQLEEKLERVQNEKSDPLSNSPWFAMFKEIAPELKELAIAFIANRNPGVNVGISGLKSGNVPPNEGETEDPEKAENNSFNNPEWVDFYKEVITDFFKIHGDPEAIRLLFCLNQFVKDQPGTFKAILPQLTKYKENLPDGFK